jgi:RNA polymerase sigma-70 factor (ECF subfamily)
LTGDPDEDLLQRIAAGDPEAVRQLVADKLPRLLALATRMLGDASEAEDVAQETFVRIWRHAGGWRWRGIRFDTWVHRVALNLCYDRLRQRRETSLAEPPEMADVGPAPDAALLAEAETGPAVERALQSIAPRQREAIVLVYYQGLSNQDAASLMTISVEALESLLARGRRSLQTILVREQKR